MKLAKRAVRPLIRRAAGTRDRLKAIKTLSEALGVNRYTVAVWWEKQAIPRWWHDKVHELAYPKISNRPGSVLPVIPAQAQLADKELIYDPISGEFVRIRK
jgi:hypothetical protein